MSAHITFHGGAGTVTGANFLLDTGEKKILIDCGILQREQVCDTANSAPFPYDVKKVDTLIVTHAHQDHIGRIPRLVRDGFRGAIHSTGATKELAALMFADALRVMQEDALKRGCEVLYEAQDIEQALLLWHAHEYHEPFEIHEASPSNPKGDASGITVEFLDAGHVLGSALVKLTRHGRTIVCTGDIGNSPEPLLKDTEFPAGTDYLVMESVYGDRVHEDRAERREKLRQCVEDTRARKGVLLIPSFSLERTQLLLFELNVMMEEGTLAPIPVYLDSPLAIEITDVFRKYRQLLNPAAQEHFSEHGDPFSFRSLKLTRGVSESRAIHAAPSPKIIIAGAGMSHGGRIPIHEKYYLSDKHATILFVGYQVPGSLGRRIEDGEKRVEIDGEHIRIYAKRETLTGYSGHADREQLLTFVEKARESLERVFVTMGEPRSSLFLAQRIQDFLGVDAIVPEATQSFDINW
ncbi:MBL fold metallo-hydrolase [Candidatus Kaiserbacteria bacterium]|nr:MBL fold metallo-hydrolase [Candidatus Kaiserbacteria bacterium]